MRKLLFVLALFGLPGGTALADSIDGEWCAPEGGKSLEISGATIRTPGGKQVSGDYRRYSFSYVAPDGDWEAGQAIDLQFIRRVGVRVTIRGGAESIWKVCPPGIS
ncbi:MAG: hypothetical protein LCH61_09180 [Proteobacteria bacterium]|nr:hypothetical protein [Pseudomonadota bacterium]